VTEDGVTIDGRTVPPGRRFRQGIVRDTCGRRTMVIRLQLESVSDIAVTVAAAKS
jgi:hypothetical protein